MWVRSANEAAILQWKGQGQIVVVVVVVVN